MPFAEQMTRVYVGCFSAGPSHISALRKAVFRCGLSDCVRSWPANPKHNLKNLAKGAHTRTFHASRKTQTSDVPCRRWSEKREKSVYQTSASDQDVSRSPFFALRHSNFLAWSHLRSSYLYPPTPAVLCNHYLAGLLTHQPPLYTISLFLFDIKSHSATNLSTVDY